MHVTSNRQGRRHRTKRPPLTAVLILALASLAGLARAAGFDESFKAPVMKSAVEFKTQAQSFSKRYAEIRAASPTQLITSASLAREQFDLKWQLQQAIDARKPLDDLANCGIVNIGHGSYFIDLAEHPEWGELSKNVIAVMLPDNLDNTIKGLTQRGFRPDDIAKLKEYLATHDFRTAPVSESVPLTVEFARAVRNYDTRKLPVPDTLVFSYWYQRARITSETDRAWADGLLKIFDAQRARILASAAAELKSSLRLIPEDASAGIQELLAQVRRPDFEQRVIDEAKGVVP